MNNVAKKFYESAAIAKNLARLTRYEAAESVAKASLAKAQERTATARAELSRLGYQGTETVTQSVTTDTSSVA